MRRSILRNGCGGARKSIRSMGIDDWRLTICDCPDGARPDRLALSGMEVLPARYDNWLARGGGTWMMGGASSRNYESSASSKPSRFCPRCSAEKDELVDDR